jgi:hypothetical protein
MARKCDPVRLMQQSGSRGWIGDNARPAHVFLSTVELRQERAALCSFVPVLRGLDFGHGREVEGRFRWARAGEAQKSGSPPPRSR